MGNKKLKHRQVSTIYILGTAYYSQRSLLTEKEMEKEKEKNKLKDPIVLSG